MQMTIELPDGLQAPLENYLSEFGGTRDQAMAYALSLLLIRQHTNCVAARKIIAAQFPL